MGLMCANGGSMAGIEDRLAGIEEQMAGIEEQMAGIEEQMAGIEEWMAGIEEQMAGNLLQFTGDGSAGITTKVMGTATRGQTDECHQTKENHRCVAQQNLIQ